MFRELRRKNQLLSKEDTIEILKNNSSGTLACFGDDGYPYSVPLSYVYTNGKIYFHCALEGHKIDAIKRNEKVSFSIIHQDDVLPEKYTTCYKSVIVFGKARILENAQEINFSIKELGRKYNCDDEEGIQKEIDTFANKFLMVEISIDHMTGKEAIELTKQRNANI